MSARTRAWVLAAAVVLVLAVEFVLFDRFGSHRITAIFPRWNDQIQYLSECYTGYEFARAHGLAAGLWHTLVNPSAQGTLHDFAALILFQFSGPSRSAALALNMIALMAWQVALFTAFFRRTSSASFAVVVAALPLALSGPWRNVPGSAYDFRLDHLAMCTIGITAASAILTRGFRDRAWSPIFGGTVAVALLTRFLTGTYFILIFATVVVWVLTGNDRNHRCINLALATLVTAVIAAPILWLNREWVWNYYYIGHYVGPESAIRNQNFGLGRSLRYVFGGLAERHLGWFFAIVAAAVSAAFTWVRYRSGPVFRTPTDASPVHERSTLGWPKPGEIAFWGFAYLLAPGIILTLHPQKSEVVLGALAPGVVLLVAAFWHWLAFPPRSPPENRAKEWGIIAGATLAAALVYFGDRQLVPVESAAALADLRKVNVAADYVFEHSRNLAHPRISVDYITDAFDAQVLRVICYERHRVWKDFDMRLPTGIAAPDAALVRSRISESDFVFLTDEAAAPEAYPFDRTLATLRPEFRMWCAQQMRPVVRLNYFGRTMTLYQRHGLN